jgi:pimeloyl-ACP methyl ester carboxylesterase
LFLHGFPSSCYDWRHQISFFSAAGYGILAPDLLGYGGTSKPTDATAYKAKQMAAEIAEILDNEKIQRIHAVSHDTGSILLSRIANYYPERLLSCTFLAVPYSKPGEHFDLKAVNAMTKQLLGKERFGYLDFFVSEMAGALLDQHVSHGLPYFIKSFSKPRFSIERILFHSLLSTRPKYLDRSCRASWGSRKMAPGRSSRREGILHHEGRTIHPSTNHDWPACACIKLVSCIGMELERAR